jgi:hypothetical protein
VSRDAEDDAARRASRRGPSSRQSTTEVGRRSGATAEVLSRGSWADDSRAAASDLDRLAWVAVVISSCQILESAAGDPVHPRKRAPRARCLPGLMCMPPCHLREGCSSFAALKSRSP